MSPLEKVKNYYSQKIMTHGTSPQGVDWNGKESQTLRFKQLIKVIDLREPFSINDFGCGYGALYSFVNSHSTSFQYNGNDISPEMIEASKKNINRSNAFFDISDKPKEIADYTLASGVFNVALHEDREKWKAYFFDQLNILDTYSLKGFAFNCLTSYSDEDKKRAHLYYADPCEVFDYCKKNFSRNVALLHDYGLYEFTILVRKV